MIVPMKKITLLCMADDKDMTLQTLRDLGAVHITPVTPPRSSELTNSQNLLKQAKSMQVILDSYRKKAASTGNEDVQINKDTVIEDASELLQRKKDLTSNIGNLVKEKLQIEPYGNFDPELINKLSATGLFLKLFSVPAKDSVTQPPDTNLFEIGRNKEHKYLLVIGNYDFSFKGKECPLPERSLAEVIADIEIGNKDLNEVESQLCGISTKPDVIKTVISDLEADIELLEAKDGMGESGRITYLQGFCPENTTEAMLQASKEHGWGIMINEPSDEERIPTLIETPAWVKPIKSLFTLLDILPGYKEIDIRSVFFIFFGLFFAMLVSDAGYGFLFLVLAFALRAKFKKTPPEPFVLAGVLSVCAIIWGVLTGSYFGIEHLPAPLSGLKLTWLKSEENIMLLSFFIGAIHLTIAHAWRAILTINSTRALGQVGWILVTWAAYFLTRFLILGHELPSWFLIIVWLGIGMIAIFMTPFKKLKTEWADHVMLPFDLVGSFADLVSYVRLFAVGSASLAVAEAFNELAIGNGVESLAAGIVAGVILFLGHSLNIILALMSILVHGVRLNTLEFSGHIGLEWSGFKYKPFASNTSVDK